jgi:hypothetical protein
VAGFCEHANEPSGYIKGGESLTSWASHFLRRTRRVGLCPALLQLCIIFSLKEPCERKLAARLRSKPLGQRVQEDGKTVPRPYLLRGLDDLSGSRSSVSLSHCSRLHCVFPSFDTSKSGHVCKRLSASLSSLFFIFRRILITKDKILPFLIITCGYTISYKIRGTT